MAKPHELKFVERGGVAVEFPLQVPRNYPQSNAALWGNAVKDSGRVRLLPNRLVS